MAEDKGKTEKKDEKKKQPEKKGPPNSLYSAITYYIGSAKSTKAKNRIEEWLGELSELERGLVEIKFKSIDPISGSVVISSIVSQKTIEKRHSAAKGYGLFSSVAINASYENIFLQFEKEHASEAAAIEEFIVSLSCEEADRFRFALVQNKQNAKNVLLSISNRENFDKMKISAKSRNLL